MFPSRLCGRCETLLDQASHAVRHHATLMNDAFYILGRDEAANKETLQELRAGLVESFLKAQSAWDAYCEHLREH